MKSPPSAPTTRCLLPASSSPAALADKLFPDGSALGKTVYLPDGPAAIIGILASLQGPLRNRTAWIGYTVLVPTHYLDPAGVVYLVRTDSTAMTSVIAATLKALQERGSTYASSIQRWRRYHGSGT
jgi:putative ABC transport system permease protein